MSDTPLYPLKFGPIYQYRIWGGRKLAKLLRKPLPENEPIGEAWILSDREDHMSKVDNGKLKGKTITELFKYYPEQLMGKLAGRFNRFPLLLKFLDAHEMLSVQVHPSDKQTKYLPEKESGKTEAWVVLEAEKESRIYAGLNSGTTLNNLRQAIADGNVADYLSYFTPKPGDAIILPAGTVHTFGGNILVFEVQQNSDVTFRLYDWNHIDAKTEQPRALQVDQALACIDFSQGASKPVIPVVETTTPVEREQVFQCEYFHLWRLQGELSFPVGEMDAPRILVCLEGHGDIQHDSEFYAMCKGDVFLLPAVVGVCTFHPSTRVNLLEIAIPTLLNQKIT
jgi:mannose-6-phosphate isomerase